MGRGVTYHYGHNPYGAMYSCPTCGARFRTVERLRAHEDGDGDLCAERAALQPRRGDGARR